MKSFFGFIFFAVFVVALTNSTVKIAKDNSEAKKTQCNVNNHITQDHAGPNTKKIEQQLGELKQEIRALKVNQTRGSGSSGLLSEVKQQLSELKQEIRAVRENQTVDCSGGTNLPSNVKQQLADLKQEIRTQKGNQTGGSVTTGLFSEVKRQLTEMKQDLIRTLTSSLKGNVLKVLTGRSKRENSHCSENTSMKNIYHLKK